MRSFLIVQISRVRGKRTREKPSGINPIQDQINIEELFEEIESLPTGMAVKHKIELLQFVLPRLKSIETPTKTLKEYIEEMDNSQIVNLLDSLLERLEE